jgi:uncharacterized protein YukE
MYGDTEVMRKHASRLREQGVEIRTMADRLVAQAEAVSWAGRAGDSMRERVRDRAAQLRESADRHDVAADSLESHLGSVEEVKETIAQAERRARALVEDGVLRGFEPPEPGHKDWLAVSLPGVGDRGSSLDPDGPGRGQG